MAAMTSSSNCSPVAGSPLMMLLFKVPTSNTAMQEGADSEDEARRRREQLNRRPSYRMILKDLETADKVMKKEPEETPPSSVDASPLQIMRPPPPQIPNNAPPAAPVVPTPNRIVTSSSAASPYGSPLGATLLNNQSLVLPFAPINGDFDFNAAIAAVSQPKPVFAGGPPQNGLGGGGGVPGPSSGIVGMSVQPPVSTPSQQQQQQQQSGVEGTSGLIGNAMKPMLGIDAVSFPAYSEFGTTDWQSPMLSGGYSSSPSPTGHGSMRMGGGPMHGGEDESNRKRQVRLLKNREAAKECRRKKKEYVKCLENRVSVLENQNKALIEELKTLKELYCRKEKDGM